MAKGLFRIFGAGAAATALGFGLAGCSTPEEAENIVDLALEKDGKAMMYVDGKVTGFDPEDARCADLENCRSLESFTQKTQAALATASPESLQSAVSQYYSERGALNAVLEHDLPNALAHVNPAGPTADDLVFIRQGLNDVLNGYGALQAAGSYEADPARIQELTTLHDTLYDAEQAQQAYEDFKAGVSGYEGFSAEEKAHLTTGATADGKPAPVAPGYNKPSL